MKQIILEDISKRFQREWIFRNVNLQFTSEKNYVILGANGSGKSTLLQCISGLLTPTKGKISFFSEKEEISLEEIYKLVSIATPYQELIEEFSLRQMLEFHQKFKKFSKNNSVESVIQLMNMKENESKLIRNFSSGMKQRVKLALAILSESDILLLDEPTSNLDQKNKEWYQNLIQQHTENRIVVVCSNHQREEYFFCTEQIEIEEYK